MPRRLRPRWWVAVSSRRQYRGLKPTNFAATSITKIETSRFDKTASVTPPETGKKRDLETITRLNRVINSLLLLSEHESPESKLEMAELPLDKLLKEVVSNSQMLAEIKSQKIVFETMTPTLVRGDRDRLYRLIFNLLENAIKFTPPSGTVSVGLVNENDMAVLRVRDNGPGIPEEDIENVFNRFYRVGKDRSRRTGGSGLGLAICKMIAWTHGGSIHAKSTMGEGTEFVVRLPISKTHGVKHAG